MIPHIYFFIDEAGDPNFYGHRKKALFESPDFERLLMLGMIITTDRRALRRQVLNFQEVILSDPLFNTIYSVKKPGWFLHASKDHSDIRLKFFEFLRNLQGIEAYVVIGRKSPEIFRTKHNSNAAEFYFDLLNKLLNLHQFNTETRYSLFLSQKQSSTMERFEAALNKALKVQLEGYDEAKFNRRIVQSRDYPEMSVTDYLLWALKRYISKPEDKRFYTVLQTQFKAIYDVYDSEGKGVIYTNEDVFELEKATPF